MALTDLIFGGDKNTMIGVIRLDASVSEVHTSEVEMTEIPVEEGVDITDHIKPLPDLLVISGIISNTPIVFLPPINAKSPVTDDFKPVTDRVNAAHIKFKQLQKEGEALDIVTTLANYEGLRIKTYVVTRDAQTGNILKFTITLREIQTSATQVIDIPDTISNKKPEDQGKKEKDPPSKKQSEKADNSTLFNLSN